MNTIRLFQLSFLTLGLFQALSYAAPAPKTAPGVPAPSMTIFEPNTRLLFQGDSITDMARGRSSDPNHILGHSFVFLLAAKYGSALAERNLTFINRGLGGNKVSDLAGRWQNDTLNLKPDILTVLVGVNDAGAGVSTEQYEANYEKILRETIAANPKVKLVLIEPFTLPGAKHANDWEAWRANIQGKQDVTARLAAKYGAALVPAQKAFDEAVKRAPVEYWIWDTIHPTYAGHQVLADAWEKTVGAFQFAEHPKITLEVKPNPAPAQNPVPVTNTAPITPQTGGQIPAAISFGAANASNNQRSIVLGWRFTTGDKALDVNSLGYFNDGANASHAVGIFDATTKTLVAPATQVTTAGGALSGQNVTFTYVRVPQPIRLAANTTYVIAATTKAPVGSKKSKISTLATESIRLRCIASINLGRKSWFFPIPATLATTPFFWGRIFKPRLLPDSHEYRNPRPVGRFDPLKPHFGRKTACPRFKTLVAKVMCHNRVGVLGHC